MSFEYWHFLTHLDDDEDDPNPTPAPDLLRTNDGADVALAAAPFTASGGAVVLLPFAGDAPGRLRMSDLGRSFELTVATTGTGTVTAAVVAAGSGAVDDSRAGTLSWRLVAEWGLPAVVAARSLLPPRGDCTAAVPLPPGELLLPPPPPPPRPERADREPACGGEPLPGAEVATGDHRPEADMVFAPPCTGDAGRIGKGRSEVGTNSNGTISQTITHRQGTCTTTQAPAVYAFAGP